MGMHPRARMDLWSEGWRCSAQKPLLLLLRALTHHLFLLLCAVSALHRDLLHHALSRLALSRRLCRSLDDKLLSTLRHPPHLSLTLRGSALQLLVALARRSHPRHMQARAAE